MMTTLMFFLISNVYFLKALAFGFSAMGFYHGKARMFFVWLIIGILIPTEGFLAWLLS